MNHHVFWIGWQPGCEHVSRIPLSNIIRFRIPSITIQILVAAKLKIIPFFSFLFSYALYLGASQQGGGISTITSSSKDLNDDRWHNVTLTRDGRKSVLSVDQITTSNIFQGDNEDLDLDGVLYVGGMKAVHPHRRFHTTETRNFHGCLQDVKYGSTNILVGAETGITGFTVHGKVSFKCKTRPNSIISCTKPNLTLRIPCRGLSLAKYFLTASFQFRTHIKEGVLVSFIAPQVKFYLFLSKSALVFEVTAVNGSKTELKLGSNLDDGEWHPLTLHFAGSFIRLGLDGQEKTKHVNNFWLITDSMNKLPPKIFLGQERRGDAIESSFVGCILDLKIQNRKITFKDLRSRDTQNAISKSCLLRNRCEPNPCQNGGKCSQDGKQYYCNCDYTNFEGKICEISFYKATCEQYKAMGLQGSTFCLLDSQGVGNPYTALCNATNSSRTYTVITHNKMAETTVGNAKIDFSRSFYKHDITYTGSSGLNQIKALIQKSKHCRQYVRFHCFGSKLLNTPRGPSHTYWLSRDGSRQEYWGGAEPGSKKCACGMTDPPSCVVKTRFCNCDVLSETWRVDAGYLSDKRTLPVTGLLFAKKSKRSKFALGPLECWGHDNEQFEEKTNEEQNENQIDYRLKKACPIAKNVRKQLVESTFGTVTPEMTALSPERTPCKAENATFQQCQNLISNPVENTSNSTGPRPGGDQKTLSLNGSHQSNETATASRKDSKVKGDELSAVAIIMISTALMMFIALFIVLDRINRKYKSPFPCKYVGAPKIHVGDWQRNSSHCLFLRLQNVC